MKLMIAPGVLEPKSADAPPRTTSIRSMFWSKRNRLSAFMKKVCIVGKTGIPSSMNITYSTPRMPRMLMFWLTSPPELSTRVNPGTYRSISVVLRGAASSTSCELSVVTATLAARFCRGVVVPVTTISVSWSGSRSRVKSWEARSPAATVTVALSGRKPSIRTWSTRVPAGTRSRV